MCADESCWCMQELDITLAVLGIDGNTELSNALSAVLHDHFEDDASESGFLTPTRADSAHASPTASTVVAAAAALATKPASSAAAAAAAGRSAFSRWVQAGQLMACDGWCNYAASCSKHWMHAPLLHEACSCPLCLAIENALLLLPVRDMCTIQDVALSYALGSLSL